MLMMNVNVFQLNSVVRMVDAMVILSTVKVEVIKATGILNAVTTGEDGLLTKKRSLQRICGDKKKEPTRR